MRPASFWIKRLLVALAIAFAVLLVVELAKGHALDAAAIFALTWGTIAASLFTGAAWYRARNGVHCALCDGDGDGAEDTRTGRPPA